jgi:RNA 3'-terminal phosphate cyclase (ATP)
MRHRKLEIDGSQGEGGGQILRTSLALSMVTGRPFVITNIRSGRTKPGLMRQHLTAVQAAAEVSGARVSGAEIGSAEIGFAPGATRPGSYRFAVGTAGSATLVLQSVLPALLVASEPSRLILEGGTHNPFAPPFDFLVRAFLPLVSRLGPRVRATLQRPGFYPAGGGRFEVEIEPVPRLASLELIDRGDILRRHACARVAGLHRSIADREVKVMRDLMSFSRHELRTEVVDDSRGPGNILVVEIESESVTEVFTGFGRRGVRAEAVAKETARAVDRYLAAGVPVGEFLADQLLLPLAIARGGTFCTLAPSRHTRTNIDVIQQFIAVEIDLEQSAADAWQIAVRER